MEGLLEAVQRVDRGMPKNTNLDRYGAAQVIEPNTVTSASPTVVPSPFLACLPSEGTRTPAPTPYIGSDVPELCNDTRQSTSVEEVIKNNEEDGSLVQGLEIIGGLYQELLKYGRDASLYEDC